MSQELWTWGPSEQARCGSAGKFGGSLHCWAPQGQECMSWQRKCVLGSGPGRVVPGGGLDGLDMLDEHVKRVDMDDVRMGAWVHQEVV